MLNIQVNTLKAALISTAKKDIRTYLCGVLLRVTESGNIYIASTDGHRLFVAKIGADWTDGEQKGPFDLIIPNEAIASAAKAKSFKVTLSALPDGRYSLADTIFATVMGKFPDINRVIPTEPLSGEVGQFDCAYLADAQKALRIACNGSDRPYYALKHNGEGSGYMAGENAFVVIMPVRTNATQDHKTFQAI